MNDTVISRPLIIPPPALQKFIDALAKNVREKGSKYESMVREKKASDPKYSFLLPSDPFNVYYKQRLELGEGILISDSVFAPENTIIETSKKTVDDTVIEKPLIIDEKPKKPSLTSRLRDIINKYTFELPTSHTDTVEPLDPSLTGRNYSIIYPQRVKDIDIDTIRLTALYTARNGKEFIKFINYSYEQDPAFAFIRPNHPLFAFFKQLCDIYSKIIVPPSDHLVNMKNSVESLTDLVDSLHIHACHNQKTYLQNLYDLQVEAEEEERTRMIDWNDCSLLAAITFDPEEDSSLGDPHYTIEAIEQMITLQETLAKEQAQIEADRLAAAMNDDDDEESYRGAYDDNIGLTGGVGSLAVEEETLEIRPYVDFGIDSGTTGLQKVMQKCNYCGEMIAADEYDEHVRIELLNPQWKAQRDELEARRRMQAEGTVSNDMIVKQLDKMVKDNKGVSTLGVKWSTLAKGENEEGIATKTKTTKTIVGPSIPTSTVQPVAKVSTEEHIKQLYNQDNQAQFNHVPLPPVPLQHSQYITPQQQIDPNDSVPQSDPKRVKYDEYSSHDQTQVYLPQTTLLPPTIPPPGTYPSQMYPNSMPIANPFETTLLSNPTHKFFIHTPAEPEPPFMFDGSILTVMASLSTTIGELKQLISQQLDNMPVTKMKINIMDGSFLNKDSNTLEFHNITPETHFVVGVKSRGRKK